MKRIFTTLFVALTPFAALLLPQAAQAETPTAVATSVTTPELLSWQTPYVYYHDMSGSRYVFLPPTAVSSWYSDAATRVKSSTIKELSTMPLAGSISYKPGERLLKFASDPKIYAVSRYGILRWITSENIANYLYGQDWKKSVEEISVADFPLYRFGSPIYDEQEYNRFGYYDVQSPSQNIVTAASQPPKSFTGSATLGIDKPSVLVGKEVTLTATLTNPKTNVANTTIRFYDSANQVLKTCTNTVACSYTFNATGPLGKQTFIARVFNEYEQSFDTNTVETFIANPS
jgi:hypothetical protein